MDRNEHERFDDGIDALTDLIGPRAAESLEGLGDLGKYVAEFAYGDIHSRPGLSARDRQIATIAMLTAKGGAERQLRLHIEGALNVGMQAREIEEVIIHTVPYAGFPGAINAITLLREVVGERDRVLREVA